MGEVSLIYRGSWTEKKYATTLRGIFAHPQSNKKVKPQPPTVIYHYPYIIVIVPSQESAQSFKALPSDQTDIWHPWSENGTSLLMSAIFT